MKIVCHFWPLVRIFIVYQTKLLLTLNISLISVYQKMCVLQFKINYQLNIFFPCSLSKAKKSLPLILKKRYAERIIINIFSIVMPICFPTSEHAILSLSSISLDNNLIEWKDIEINCRKTEILLTSESRILFKGKRLN